jgi:uncharacterized membrane protein YeaQ/YmgE (transglycosylase-associated protein family)
MYSRNGLFVGALAGVLLGVSGAAQAQLVTQDLTQDLTPTDLVNTLVGPGVVVSNVQFFGADAAAGKVSGGTGIIGFANGIMLSTGCISNVVALGGQNNDSGITCDNLQPGDPDLDALIPGYTTFDRTVLEFDFECDNIQVISFQYVFSSDEYNEYANTDFNDVFGFFVNGVNVARLPDNVTPVSINNVNCGNPVGDPTPHNCAFFINNACQGPPGLPDLPYPCVPPLQTEMDGMTVVLYVFTSVNPGLNHIKLAIADAGDPVLDSNVFIRTQSFTCTPPGTTGACCLPNGTCDDETAADCAEDGGVFHPETTCDDVSCGSCPGDIDSDGQVGVVDFLALLEAWGPNPGHPADVDGDGNVGVVDFLALLGNWGACP